MRDRFIETVSIGFHREDGDFQIMATLNNKDGLVSATYFERLCRRLAEDLGDDLHGGSGEPLVILEREDAPDYVDSQEVNHGTRIQSHAKGAANPARVC